MLSFVVQVSNANRVQIKKLSYKNKISVVRKGRELKRKLGVGTKLIITQRVNRKWINVHSE